jgi:PAS domain S-box-containing protein
MTTLSRVLAGLVIIIGVAGLSGWMFDIYFLRAILPNASTMRVNTAICFVLSGISLLLIPNHRFQSTSLAIVVLLVSFFTLTEYVTDMNFGIDEFFYTEKDHISQIGRPGRMSFNTAVGFLLCSIAVLCYTKQNNLHKIAQLAAVVIFFIGLAPLMGYIVGGSLYGSASMYTQMAFPTAIAFVSIGLAFLLRFPEKGYVAVINGKYLGSAFARIIFVLSTIVPALLSGVLILLNEQGYTASYLTIFVCCMAYALITIMVTYKHLAKINQVDVQRLQLLADIEAKNKQLASTNVELAVACEELSSTNEELMVSNEQLEVLNTKLIDANHEIKRLSNIALEEIENKYRHLTESISDIFFALDHELKFTYWNKASEINSGGLKAEQVIGKPLYELFPGLRGSVPEKCYLDALRTREFQRCIFEATYMNQTHTYDVSVYPYEEGLTVFIKDITQKKLAEAQLNELQSRFESIISSAMDAIITTDESRSIILFNHAAEKMFGYRADEVLGKSIQQVISQPLFQSNYTTVDVSYAGISNEDMGKTLFGIRSDGSQFPVEASVSELSLEEKHYFTVISEM